MSWKIPSKPHRTPDPEKSHSGSRTDGSSHARSIHGAPGGSGQLEEQRTHADTDKPIPDSCHDDLDVVLSQSMQQPDPDPYLQSADEPLPQEDGADSEVGRSSAKRGKTPRTSEIFRSVVAPVGAPPPASESPPAGVQDVAVGDMEMPDISLLDRGTGSTGSHDASDRHHDGNIPWGQIVLLSYSSVLTLALIWLFWTGRIPKTAAPVPPAAERTAVDSAPHIPQPASDPSPPPLPPENVTTLGKPIRLGDLLVTPLSVEAVPVDLVHTIDARARRREKDCLVLRLLLMNQSKDQTFAPVDPNLVRERELRLFDPYIATSEGRSIPLFPLAMDSEWSIRGQDFPVLGPGESGRTFIAAEPGSANHLAEEMTWRLRLRIGAYRSDMIGVRFTKSEVRRPIGRK